MIDLHALDVSQLEQLRDAINRRLLLIRRTEGLRLPELLELLEEVKSTLHDQGKEWYSLERWQWMEGGIKFWLNPSDQDMYRPGWYTIDELIAWAHDTGPVLLEDLSEEGPDPFALPSADRGVAIRWLPSASDAPDDRESRRLPF